MIAPWKFNNSWGLIRGLSKVQESQVKPPHAFLPCSLTGLTRVQEYNLEHGVRILHAAGWVQAQALCAGGCACARVLHAGRCSCVVLGCTWVRAWSMLHVCFIHIFVFL